MADFVKCLHYVLQSEDPLGRCEEVPDPTKSDLSAYSISGINSHYWPEDFERVYALPRSQRMPEVFAFYEKNFWNKWLAGIVLNNPAAYILDCTVNPGPSAGVKIAQNALVILGASALEVDGHLGPETLSAVNSVDPGRLLTAMMLERTAYYRMRGGPNLEGWLARASRLPNLD